MKEVKTPKKPLFYYYALVILVLLLFNFLAMPLIARQQVEEVDYGTFMTMTENQEIGQVEIESNQILFTNKDGSKVYKTGVLDDPDLVERLHASGAEFASEIVEQMSPFLNILLTWILPVVLFVAIGQYMAKKLTDKAGGGSGSMMFGMGKSNARSTSSPRRASALPMWPARTRPRKICRRWSTTSTTPANIRPSAHPCPRASCW